MIFDRTLKLLTTFPFSIFRKQQNTYTFIPSNPAPSPARSKEQVHKQQNQQLIIALTDKVYPGNVSYMIYVSCRVKIILMEDKFQIIYCELEKKKAKKYPQ